MLTRERSAPANLFESGPPRMAANHSSTASPVASPLPFRGRHVSGDALFSAALGAPRTPPPRDTAPTPGLTQAAEAPASAPAAPQPPAASEGLNAQVATALSQVSAALSAQSMAAIASAAAASAAKAAVAESAPGANDKATKTEETPRSPWTDGEHPAFTVDGERCTNGTDTSWRSGSGATRPSRAPAPKRHGRG